MVSEGRTLGDCLSLASRYWEAKGPSSRMMPHRARACVDLIGGPKRLLEELTAADGTTILTGLKHLSRSSQASYYAAFRRMLALSGISTVAWPAGRTPPRRVREPLLAEDLQRLIDWFRAEEYPETADLAVLLRDTGMRVEVEALSRTAVEHDFIRSVLTVTGKGEHERRIPIASLGAVHQLLQNRERLKAMRGLTYAGHLRRWNQGVRALGISSRLPTPHAVRHLYATRAYERCKDLRVVAELLGHADVNTTARYVGVDMEGLRHAAGA